MAGDIRSVCGEHGVEIIWEPGGDTEPTIFGRWYCPECQDVFVAWLDEVARP